jgi:hypothetical protein
MVGNPLGLGVMGRLRRLLITVTDLTPSVRHESRDHHSQEVERFLGLSGHPLRDRRLAEMLIHKAFAALGGVAPTSQKYAPSMYRRRVRFDTSGDL